MSRAGAGTAAFAIVVLCAVTGLVAVALLDERDIAFTPGVRPTQVAVVLDPGERACQRPIDAAADARGVRFQVGTFGAPGPALAVQAGPPAGRERVTVLVPAGYADVTWQRASLGRGVFEGERIELCVLNRGDRRVALYGGPAQAARTSSAYAGDRRLTTDIALVFERARARSAVALVPTAFERATLWHPGWVGAWLFWLLLGALIAGIPLLLAAALARAFRTE